MLRLIEKELADGERGGRLHQTKRKLEFPSVEGVLLRGVGVSR